MPFLNEADREKVERWFAVERFKIRARNDIAEHFSGERNNSESTDKYVVVKEVDEATEKARQEKYSSFVEAFYLFFSFFFLLF